MTGSRGRTDGFSRENSLPSKDLHPTPLAPFDFHAPVVLRPIDPAPLYARSIACTRPAGHSVRNLISVPTTTERLLRILRSTLRYPRVQRRSRSRKARRSTDRWKIAEVDRSERGVGGGGWRDGRLEEEAPLEFFDEDASVSETSSLKTKSWASRLAKVHRGERL